jgi:hypothetical protein
MHATICIGVERFHPAPVDAQKSFRCPPPSSHDRRAAPSAETTRQRTGGVSAPFPV